MTIPFRPSRRHHETGQPDELSDTLLLARLRRAGTVRHEGQDLAGARDRVWRRLAAEHPGAEPADRPSRPSHASHADRASNHRDSTTPVAACRSAGGLRAAGEQGLDVASVAVLIIGLILSARGAGLGPSGGNPNPMTTQSVAAASPTQPLSLAEDGTNQQPGPGPRLTPTLIGSTNDARRIQGDPVLADGVVYALTPLTADTFLVAGYDPATLAEVWSSEQPGTAVGLAVSGDTVSVVARRPTGHGTLTRLSTTGDGDDWTLALPFEPIGVSSSADTVLVSGHDESTGTPNAGQPGDVSRLLAVEPADGSTRWDIGLTNPAGVEPLLTDDGIYYTTANGAVKAIEPGAGAIRWTTGTGGLRITSRPIAGGDLLYVVRPDGVVVALDRRTGEERWGRGVRTQDLGVPPLITRIDGKATPVPAPVLALSRNGELLVGYVWADGDLSGYAATGQPLEPNTLIGRIVALDAMTGSPRWSEPAGFAMEPRSEALALDLTVADDQVFTATGAGVAAYSATSGAALWSVPVEGTIAGRMVVVDHAVVVTHNVVLAALREPAGMASTATPGATPGATPAS